MNINALKKTRFLNKEQCGPGILVTIRGDVTWENVAAEGAPVDKKPCLHFQEIDKPLILNSTNAQIIATITGSPKTESWNGTKIVLYHDPAISFGGKVVGGIRVRAPRPSTVEPEAKPKPTPQAAHAVLVETSVVQDDDVPF